MTILELTEERLRAQAREAAEQHIPLNEANHYEFGSKLWAEFNRAYADHFHARDCRELARLNVDFNPKAAKFFDDWASRLEAK